MRDWFLVVIKMAQQSGIDSGATLNTKSRGDSRTGNQYCIPARDCWNNADEAER